MARMARKLAAPPGRECCYDLFPAWGEWMSVVADRGCLVSIMLPGSRERAQAEAGQARWAPDLPLLARARAQLLGFLAGHRRDLDLPWRLEGVSAFRQAVLEATARIPYGQVRTYGQVAAAIGRPAAARAAGQALHHNPLPLLIPCHRVVGAGGGLVGFGSGVEMKQRLLALEAGRG